MPATVHEDIQEFLDGYPNRVDDKSQSKNLEFYLNQQPCQPYDIRIEEIHETWRGDYAKLEYEHAFIQWLFPIQEQGVNSDSQPLQKHEIAAMKTDEDIIARVLRSYRLMLDFYGMELSSSDTGLLGRAGDTKKRYGNLVKSPHNNLRITRILKCLSEMGLERLNAGLLLHVLNEQSEHRELAKSAIRKSMDEWWANCIRDDDEREWIGKMIQKVRNQDDFVFTRELYEGTLNRRRRRAVSKRIDRFSDRIVSSCPLMG